MLSYSDGKGHGFPWPRTCIYLVGRTGFEPVTSSVSGKSDDSLASSAMSLTCGSVSVVVRHSPSWPLAIVTQLVTRALRAWRRGTPASMPVRQDHLVAK
jgi:hypothetical protein